jgi:glucokinase
MTEYVLALDVGGTKLAAGLLTRAGSLSYRCETPTLAHAGGGPAVMRRLIELSRQALSTAGFREAGRPPLWLRGQDRVAAVGLGTGGQIDPASGAVLFANENIPGWTGVPARQMLEDALYLPADVDNDANCAALAEAHFGVGRGYPYVLCITVGTGIGGGFVMDGQVYRGAHGGALEAGHILVDYQGLPCVCGQRGCLEMYASGPSILAEFLRRHGEAGLRELIGVAPASASTRDIVAAAGRGVPEAAAVVVNAAQFLGIGLASLAHVFDPHITVIGGGMSDVWEMLYPPMAQAYAERSMPPTRATPIMRAHFRVDAVLLGAGQLAWGRLDRDA